MALRETEEIYQRAGAYCPQHPTSQVCLDTTGSWDQSKPRGQMAVGKWQVVRKGGQSHEASRRDPARAQGQGSVLQELQATKKSTVK